MAKRTNSGLDRATKRILIELAVMLVINYLFREKSGQGRRGKGKR